MGESGALKWREVVDKHHSSLLDELSTQYHADLQDALSGALASERTQLRRQIAQACDDARRSHAELLNQALRRQRQAAGQEQVLQFLIESCSPFADKAVVLVFENNQARSVATKGLGGKTDLAFALTDARAIVSAIESRDPVVALASPEELSAALARALRDEVDREEADGKAYLFPLVARQAVVAVLAASGAVEQPPVELLCGVAAMRIEALFPETIRRVPSGISSWDDLPPEEQKIHLQAQRMARVRVAEMRLQHEDALRNGTAARDIYAALKTPIDAAREQFQQSFLSSSPTMVDYLHLEILRTLANDDDQLLGPAWPGPMV